MEKTVPPVGVPHVGGVNLTKTGILACGRSMPYPELEFGMWEKRTLPRVGVWYVGEAYLTQSWSLASGMRILYPQPELVR